MDYNSLEDKDFKDFSALIYSSCGINITAKKKIMLETRLSKRIRVLGLRSYREYYDLVCSDVGRNEEFQLMIDEVTTNKTDFFREPSHFDFLAQEAFPALLHTLKKRGHGIMNIWSAACSSGEEPYSIAMTASDFAKKNPGMDYSILASDLCLDVLCKASLGIFTRQLAEPVPDKYYSQFIMTSKDPDSDLVRIIPEIRSKINFKQINFLQDNFPAKRNKDIIFCRNALIYFDGYTKEKIVNRLCKNLRPGGFFFLGHAESLQGISSPLRQICPTVFTLT